MSLLEPNQRVGNYQVVKKIGAGGMGEVWQAEQTQIGSRVALKVLLPGYSHEPEMAMRFFNEARAVNVVGHPSLVQIFDFGTLPNGSCYIAMEYLDGESLSSRLARKGRLGADALRIARQAASALAAAHSKGIIHRDLKPDNLYLVGDPEAAGGERVKLLDFGIAKMVRQPAQEETVPAQTAPEVFMGTPPYMSPEQCRGAGNVEAKSDVYSLGVMLFEMLSGNLPFPGNAPVGELIAMHMYATPPRLTELDPTITAEVSAIVERMLAKQPALRPSMQEVVQELEDLGAPKATGPVQRLSWGPENRIVFPSYSASTLGTLSGQRARARRPASPADRPRMLLAAAVLLGIAGAAAALLIGRGAAHRQAPAISASKTPPAVPSPAPMPTPAAPSAPPGPVAPPLRQVRWTIASHPSDAEVLDVDRSEVLGRTPWVKQRPAATGQVHLRLHRRGYKDKDLVVDAGRDYQADEQLERQVADSPRMPGRRDPSGTLLMPLFPARPGGAAPMKD
jgi:serine/threonine-protein kinase